MTDPPIACTLAPDRMRGRLAFIDALTADALLDQQPIAGGMRSRFLDAAGIEERVRELVELESRCCAFLRFAIGRDRDAIVLDITGSADAQPVIEQYFAGRLTSAAASPPSRPAQAAP
jgi:hypothetical protein